MDVGTLSREAQDLLSGLTGPRTLEDLGMDQVDVVLLLLRANLIPDVEAIVGHPVTLLPSFPVPDIESVEDNSDWLQGWLARHPDVGDIRNWRVRRVTPGVRTHPTAQERHSRIKPGMSVRALLARGVRWADINTALDRGWLDLVPA